MLLEIALKTCNGPRAWPRSTLCAPAPTGHTGSDGDSDNGEQPDDGARRRAPPPRPPRTVQGTPSLVNGMQGADVGTSAIDDINGDHLGGAPASNGRGVKGMAGVALMSSMDGKNFPFPAPASQRPGTEFSKRASGCFYFIFGCALCGFGVFFFFLFPS